MLAFRRMRLAEAVWRTARPVHWVKNGFVLAPAVFAGHATEPQALALAAGTAAAFCLASSAGYFVNDVLDREADRADPVKRRRPVASGALRPATALGWGSALVLAALAGAALLGGWVAACVAAYLGLTFLYSLVLKRVPVLEAMVLGAMFLVRLAAGALAIRVPISHWLLICGFGLALLLAFGKRVPEVDHLTSRSPLYPATFLHEVVTLLAGVTVVSYTLYTVAPDTVAKVGSHALLLTVPLVLFGVLRYLLLLHREGAQDPTATLVRDRPLLATVVLWGAAAGAIVYLAGGG